MKQTELHPVVRIQLYTDDKCFGPGIAQLLELVAERKSLRAAAPSMGMAYSKAWTVVRRCEESLGYPLLLSSTGGRHGGGAELTDEARAMLAGYRAYCRALNEAAERLFPDYFPGSGNPDGQ